MTTGQFPVGVEDRPQRWIARNLQYQELLPEVEVIGLRSTIPMDPDEEAASLWQGRVLATYQLHRELHGLVRAGRLSVDPYAQLRLCLDRADAAFDAWTQATKRADAR